MNPTEDFGNFQNHSEPFSNMLNGSEDLNSFQSPSKRTGGIGRGKKYPGAETPYHDVSEENFFIMEQAYAMFENQGERRSVRMIAEYCKTGELVCIYDSDDKRWHITRASVGNKIAKIKALNARKAVLPSQSTSEPFSERPAAPHKTTEGFPPGSEATPPSSEATKKIHELEQDIFDLKVLNKSKDLYIAQLVDDRQQLLTRVETASRLIGKLKLKLFQLMAPGTPRDISILGAPPSTPSEPPASNVSPHEPLADNTNSHYEHSPH